MCNPIASIVLAGNYKVLFVTMSHLCHSYAPLSRLRSAVIPAKAGIQELKNQVQISASAFFIGHLFLNFWIPAFAGMTVERRNHNEVANKIQEPLSEPLSAALQYLLCGLQLTVQEIKIIIRELLIETRRKQ